MAGAPGRRRRTAWRKTGARAQVHQPPGLYVLRDAGTLSVKPYPRPAGAPPALWLRKVKRWADGMLARSPDLVRIVDHVCLPSGEVRMRLANGYLRPGRDAYRRRTKRRSGRRLARFVRWPDDEFHGQSSVLPPIW